MAIKQKPKSKNLEDKRIRRLARKIITLPFLRRLSSTKNPERIFLLALESYAVRRGLTPGQAKIYLQELTRYALIRAEVYRASIRRIRRLTLGKKNKRS